MLLPGDLFLAQPTFDFNLEQQLIVLAVDRAWIDTSWLIP